VEAKVKECKSILRDIKTIVASEIEFCRTLKMMAGKTVIKQTPNRRTAAPDDYNDMSVVEKLNLRSQLRKNNPKHRNLK